jgi:hypothetical protein
MVEPRPTALADGLVPVAPQAAEMEFIKSFGPSASRAVLHGWIVHLFDIRDSIDGGCIGCGVDTPRVAAPSDRF